MRRPTLLEVEATILAVIILAGMASCAISLPHQLP